jgi:hypothetical protein
MKKTARIKLFVFTVLIGLMQAITFGSRTGQAQTPTQQQPPPSQEKEQRPAGQQPETLQVLKGMNRQQIMAEMRKITEALHMQLLSR